MEANQNTPQYVQNNLQLLMTHNLHTGIEEFKFTYIHPEIHGIHGEAMLRTVDNTGTLRWRSFFPNGGGTHMFPMRIGVGSFAQAVSLLAVAKILGKDEASTRLVAEDHKPREERIRLLESLGLDWKSSYSFYNYLAASLEGSKRKGYQIGETEIRKVDDDRYRNIKTYLLKFPFSPLNIVDCQQCILHSCRLNNVFTPKDLWEVLNSDSYYEMYSDRVVDDDGYSGSRPRTTIFERANTLYAECYGEEIGKVYGVMSFKIHH